MKIEQWPPNKFIEYINNPRKNDHAVDKVAAAIHEFGFRCPVIAKSDGTLVDGHLRLKAARKLNLETVPVILADDLTDAQIKAFRISVNQVASIAEFDLDLLKIEIEGLEELDFDIDLLGFDDDFLDELNDDEKEVDLKDQDYQEVFNIVVECDNEIHQEFIYKQLSEKGYKCQVQSL